MSVAPADPDYAELHALSNFTFLRGASHPHELIEQAHRLGYRALALTDECSVAGIVRAHVAAKKTGLHLIVGTELRLDDGLRLVLLAPERAAYGEICTLITAARRNAAKGEYAIDRALLERGSAHCLALWLPDPDEAVADDAIAIWLGAAFPARAWIAVELFHNGADAERLRRLRDCGARQRLPLLAAGDVRMHERARQPLADVLAAIRLHTTVDQLGWDATVNAERQLRPRRRLARLYPSELLAETVAVAARCRFTLDELRYIYPREVVPEGRTPTEHLRALTETGAARRWPGGVAATVRAQLEHELALIAELGYEAYFLTVHDIVEFARGRGILCQGRGSAANSAVCFCLGITEVDPARMELLFERFISRERNEPPDIDIDFEHERREEVLQYLYRKYGRDRAALVATVITYRSRSALRDVGKTLGIPMERLALLTGKLHWWDGRRILPERLSEVGFDPGEPRNRRLLELATTLIGFPRHLSQHTGGMVISDPPLTALVPIENAAMPERTVMQWDKDDLGTLGLLKIDCLCLGMLSAIRRALALLSTHEGRRWELAEIPAEDPETYAMIQRADTVGVFQIESRAQMAMLPRLKPAHYYDLVIEIAIIRPGPIQGEMVHPYLRRRNGEEPVVYPSPELRAVLARTLGVPLFQEQVIKLAMVAAGFSPGEADQLRRAMATWRRDGAIDAFRERFVGGMQARGYETEFATRVFAQIQGFGEYGFPESHAASFALLAYTSAWLKRHRPAAFTAALLNSQPMGFYAPSQLVQDARRHGVEVRPIEVGSSAWDCILETTVDPQRPAVRLGLRLLSGLSRAAAERIVAAGVERPFGTVTELARRACLNRGELRLLSGGGALRALHSDRHRAVWAALGAGAMQAGERAAARQGRAGGVAEPPAQSICPLPEPAEAMPLLRPSSEGEQIVADYAHSGLSLERHPLALLRSRLDRLGFVTADRLRQVAHGRLIRTGGIVVTRQRPGTASGIVFVTLEDETGVINLIVHAKLVDTQRRELLDARLLGVVGRVQREGEVLHVIARRLRDHTALLGRLSVASRDFH